MTDPVTLAGEGTIAEFDEKRAENAVRELLIAVGEDPDREGLRETPGRVARAYREIFAGLWQKPEDVLTTTFDLGHDEMVLVKDIEVLSSCEHHLVPFVGFAGPVRGVALGVAEDVGVDYLQQVPDRQRGAGAEVPGQGTGAVR